MENLSSWLGKTETEQDVATLRPAMALAATLDRTDLALEVGAQLPPCWHWLYFLPLAAQSSLGPDGHPRRGGFLPPVALPRRMWAGSRVEFIAPILIGVPIERTSTILRIDEKTGRSGALCFVTVRHEVKANGSLAIREEQDVVYRDAPAAGKQPPVTSAATQADSAAPSATWSRAVNPDPVMLFRYSALTFNGHRIHYDCDYAVHEEGYPALVVHGPLQATLLLDLISRNMPAARVKKFSFKAQSPLFSNAPFNVSGLLQGNAIKLWTGSSTTPVSIEAQAELDSRH